MNKKKTIVFIETSPTIYSYKISKALKERGHSVNLLSILKFDDNFYKSAYDKIIKLDLDFSFNLKNGINLIKTSPFIMRKINKIRKLKPDIIIGTANPYPIWLPALSCFLTNGLSNTPFVFLPYDVNLLRFNEKKYYDYTGIKWFEHLSEKYLLRNADGIIFKGDEYKYASKRINILCPVLNFPPYSSKSFMKFPKKDKLSNKDNEIHCVYVGFVNREEELVKEGNKFQKIVETLEKNKIHLHIYSTQNSLISNSGIYSRFSNLHLHQTFGPKEIIEEISKYDFGLNPTFINSPYTAEFISSGTGNKLASYIEAGIPFASDPLQDYSLNLMKKYKLNFAISESQLNKLKSKIFLNKIMKNLDYAREDFTMEKNVYKIEKFFSKII